jgi:hypothetical protein|tara:strand:+ start:101 stop:316 length:216 start_codon:yes stop_codon:yes gene_type:complete
MKIYCNEKVTPQMLNQDDWIVSNDKDHIATGNKVGCHTIFIGNKTNSISPTLFAPTAEYAMQFIQANSEIN